MPQNQARLDTQFTFGPEQNVTSQLQLLMKVLESRLQRAEGLQEDAADQAESLVSVGLKRINEVLVPEIVKIQDLARLGFLVCHSNSSVKLDIGAQKTFLVPDEGESDYFKPSPFVAIERTADFGTWAIGQVLAWDPNTGALLVTILSAAGDGQIHTDWTISCSAGIGLAAQTAATSAASSAALAVARAQQTALDAARTADDRAASAASRDAAAGSATDASASKAAAAASATQAAQSAAAAPGVRTDADQGLVPAQRAQGKRNLRIGQANRTLTTNNIVLTADDIGRIITNEAGATNVTLPKITTVESGGQITFYSYNTPLTVNTDASDTYGIYDPNNPGLRSIVIPVGWSLRLENRDIVWLYSLVPYWGDTPSASGTATFTAAQKKKIKQQIGAGGFVGGYSATTTLTVNEANRSFYVNSAGFSITLPNIATVVNGDYFEFTSIADGTFTVARNAGDNSAIAYGDGKSASNITVGPGQTLKLICDGSNWLAFSRGLAPERAVGVDPQAFSSAQRRQAKSNIGAPNSGFRYLTASTVLDATDNGKIIAVQAGGVTITLPLISTLGGADSIKIVSFNCQVNVALGGTDRALNNGDLVTSFNIRPNQTVEFFTDGSYWVAASSYIPLGSAPSYNEQQTTTDAQKSQAKSNIEAADFGAMAAGNLILNSYHGVYQEGATFNIGPQGARNIADMWAVAINGQGTLRSDAVASPFPTAPWIGSGIKITSTSAFALAASDYLQYYQAIEGIRAGKLALGTAGAQPFTVAFFIRPSFDFVGGARLAALNTVSGSTGRTYIKRFTAPANVDTFVSFVVPGDVATGIWPLGNTSQAMLQFGICLGAGANRTRAEGGWAADGGYLGVPDNSNIGAANGQNVCISHVQIYPGVVPLTLAASYKTIRPFAEDIRECERYYQRGFLKAMQSGPFVGGSQKLRALMRLGAPSLIYTDLNGSAGYVSVSTQHGAYITGGSISVSSDTIQIDANINSQNNTWCAFNYILDCRMN